MIPSDVDNTYDPVRRQRNRAYIVLSTTLLCITAIAIISGRYQPQDASPVQLFHDPLYIRIILTLRLPRIVTAIIGGAVLAGAGFVFQMLFSNPLVEPGFLGVSQGASFGAALTILVFGYVPVLTQIGSTIFALVGLALSFTLARRFQFGGWILRLILSGIAVSALFSSGVGIIKVLADPTNQLQDITFWLLGALWSIDWGTTISILPVSLISLTVLILFRWRIAILSTDERTAHMFGLNPVMEKRFILFIATMGTASIISVSGLIGWVGLIVPHLGRKVFGSDPAHALPGSMLIGAGYLLICDTLGRSLLSGEIPLGILTSITGTVLFMVLLMSQRGLGESS